MVLLAGPIAVARLKKVCKIGNKCLLWNESEGNLGKTIFNAMNLIGHLLQPFAVVLRITGSNADRV